MKRSTVERVAGVRPVAVEGIFYRHAAVNRDAFAGGLHGRWGAHFPVIYLGRPEAAPVAEAYRHLVEEAGIPAHAVQPRVLYTVRVRAQDIVDLTDPANLDQVGLTDDDLTSVVDEYERCQEVAAAAHQLTRHGVLAPAAHGLGETLALFRQRIDHRELPVVEQETIWTQLPPDPREARVHRTLRAVRGEHGPGQGAG
jgi:RES domain-containing protein